MRLGAVLIWVQVGALNPKASHTSSWYRQRSGKLVVIPRISVSPYRPDIKTCNTTGLIYILRPLSQAAGTS